MKTGILAAVLVAAMAIPSAAQTLNWSGMQENQRHIINANVSWDYAATVGLGYGYRMETRVPTILSAQFSLPAGEDLVDDFKAKVGGQVRVLQRGRFQASVAMYGLYRQTTNHLVKLQNFGGEFTGVIGYYRPRWFVAAECGFDKAIVTRIRNSEAMKRLYPDVRDGWYVPTGGNFVVALQTGYSLKSVDFILKAGKVIDQNLRSSATVPLTVQFGVNARF